MSRSLILTAWISTAVLAVAGAAWPTVGLAQQVALLEGLRNTSSIVFAAMGGWFALLHSATQAQPKLRDDAWNQRIDHILLSMKLSGFVLLIVVLFGLVAPALQRIQFGEAFRALLLHASFGLCAMLTAVQVWAVALTFLPLIWAQGAQKAAKLTIQRHKTMYGNADEAPPSDPVAYKARDGGDQEHLAIRDELTEGSKPERARRPTRTS